MDEADGNKAEEATQPEESKPKQDRSTEAKSKPVRSKSKGADSRLVKEPAAPKGKSLPDISKLSSARPTKVPKTAKAQEEIIQESRPRPNFKWLGIGAAAIVLIVAAVYTNSLYNDIVFNDGFNFHNISHAMQDQSFWLQHWVDAVKQPLTQPWVTATYGWDLTSFKWNPGWSHLVNVVLHLTACLYLYLLIFSIAWRLNIEERLKPSAYIVAAAVAALFAVHPLTTGAVAYISGRTGPLLAANYFLALNFFVLGYISENLSLALAAYLSCFLFNAIGLFCNVGALTLPLSVVTLGLLLKEPKQTWKAWFDSRGYELAMFVAAAVGEPFLLRLGVPPMADNGMGLHTLSSMSYMASQCKSVVTYYLRCFFVPYNLTTDPPYVVASGFHDPTAIAGIAVIAASLAAMWIWRKHVLLVFGLELFLVGLLPASLIVQPELVADQRFYLSLAGLCIVAGWGVAEFYVRNKRVAIIAAAVLLVGLGALTVWRNHQWSSDEILWQQAIKLNPSSARAYAMYARSLNKPEKAVEEAQKALALDPQNVIALQTMADWQRVKENYAAAEDSLEKAISISRNEGASDQDVATLQRDLVQCYVKENKLDKALPLAQKVLKSLPEDPIMHLAIAQALIAKKEYILAFSQLARSLRQDPHNPEILKALADAGMNSGVEQWMEQGYMAALEFSKVKPGSEARILLTKCMLSMGEGKEALETLQPVLKLSKFKDAETAYLCSLAQEELHNPVAAQQAKEAALKLDPKIAEKIIIHHVKRPTANPATFPGAAGSTSVKKGASSTSTETGAGSTNTRTGASSTSAGTSASSTSTGTGASSTSAGTSASSTSTGTGASSTNAGTGASSTTTATGSSRSAGR